MRYVRFLIPLALLFMAVPAFAVCGYCDQFGNCTRQTGLFQSCHYEFPNSCTVLCVEEGNPNCSGGGFAARSFSNDYRIMSVTVEDAKASPAKDQAVVIQPKKVKKQA